MQKLNGSGGLRDVRGAVFEADPGQTPQPINSGGCVAHSEHRPARRIHVIHPTTDTRANDSPLL